MKIANRIVEFVLTKQANRKERRRQQYAADAFAAATSQDYRDHRPRRHR